jgi:SAM-dependent methyltransferase
MSFFSCCENYRGMHEITEDDYVKFRRTHDWVIIEDTRIDLPLQHEIKYLEPKDHVCKRCGKRYRLEPPSYCNCGSQEFREEEYEEETTTVWSFPERGNWATHQGNYRGNWSPYIPRNLIKRYTDEGDLVLDQMVGSGTTLVECKLLNRRAIGVDINPDAIMVTRNRLNFKCRHNPEIRTFVGDARNLDLIEDETIDLIAFHPPYAYIIPYTKSQIEGDLSRIRNIDQFVAEMRKVAEECYRVLKPGKYCAFLIGETREHRHMIPVSWKVLRSFLETGFILKEDIIKLQWNMKVTRERWLNKQKKDFLLIAHEHLFVLRKPRDEDERQFYINSVKL